MTVILQRRKKHFHTKKPRNQEAVPSHRREAPLKVSLRLRREEMTQASWLLGFLV